MNSETNHTKASARVSRCFDRDWLFCYDPASAPDADRAAAAHGSDDFYGIALPHTWHTFETTGQVHPFIRNPSETDNPYWWYGWGWYRKHWRLDAALRGRRVFLEFDGVQKYARIYCNGNLVGEHKGGFTSFSVDITDAVRWGEENTVAVAVSARRDDDFGNIPPMMAGNWNMYGGIYRGVRLVLTGPVYIPFQGSAQHEGGTFVTTPEVSREGALVQIVTHVRNAGATAATVLVCHEVLDATGEVVTAMEGALHIPAGEQASLGQTSPRISAPRLWSPAAPYLYQVRTTILSDNQVVDTHESALGFRWFHWDYETNTLWLNDEPIHIHGTNRHQEYPWLGDALPQWIHRLDLDDMHHGLAHNFIRFCHYTQDTSVYDYCDRHGILVCEEVPCIKNLPFGREAQQQQVVEMIRRDRNHPCIVMWSLGNETNNAADGAWAKEEDETRILHYRHVQGLDPDGRHTHRNLDMENLLRCTVRGWPASDAMTASGAPAPQDAANGQITGSEDWQCQTACIDGGSIRGCIDRDLVAWIYADHGADREYGDCPLKHINPKGWVDAYRQPKYLYYLWQAHYAPRLMVFAQPHWWHRDHLGTRRDIKVYANADEVELFVGDRLFGSQAVAPDQFHTVVFQGVPVSDALLRVVARRGAEQAEQVIPMAGPPAHLHLVASHDRLSADRAGIALLTVSVTDANGNEVHGSSPTLHWELDGPASLPAPATWTSDLDKREADEGTAYFVLPVSMPLRTTEVPGTIRVTVSSPGLRPASVTLVSEPPPAALADGIEEFPAPAGNLQRRLSQQREGQALRAGNPAPIRIIHSDLHFRDAAGAVLSDEEIYGRLRELLGEATCARHGNEVQPLLDSLVAHARSGEGTLIADDYNFQITQFNRKLTNQNGEQ